LRRREEIVLLLTAQLVLAASAAESLRQFVTAYKVHPILVNFTAALIPVSVVSDILGRILAKETLRH
jgi:hypothetical protein